MRYSYVSTYLQRIVYIEEKLDEIIGKLNSDPSAANCDALELLWDELCPIIKNYNDNLNYFPDILRTLADDTFLFEWMLFGSKRHEDQAQMNRAIETFSAFTKV